MKISKSDALSATFSRPELRFEQQDLTSFSGLVLFQSLFARLGLYRRLARCFRNSVTCPIYPQAKIILLLIVHMLLGFRCLRESRYYGDDPMVLRLIGLKQLPAVSTISRQLSSLDESCVQKLEALRRELVLDRLTELDSPRITLDFDRPALGVGDWHETQGRRHSRGFQQIQERPTQLLSTVLHRCTDRSGARRVEPFGKRARFQWRQGVCA